MKINKHYGDKFMLNIKKLIVMAILPLMFSSTVVAKALNHSINKTYAM
ncbi:hypothetical protein [Candidatus Tisiphia endosymbiont of Dascillus cervinus]